MIDYISGKISELTPTTVVVENNGIGYAAEISLQTYALLENKGEGKVFIQSQVNPRDGSQVDYGFATKDERALFQAFPEWGRLLRAWCFHRLAQRNCAMQS